MNTPYTPLLYSETGIYKGKTFFFLSFLFFFLLEIQFRVTGKTIDRLSKDFDALVMYVKCVKCRLIHQKCLQRLICVLL